MKKIQRFQADTSDNDMFFEIPWKPADNCFSGPGKINPSSLRRKAVDYLIETVAFIVEISRQSKRPTTDVCFPDAICDLCCSLGHDPWVLLDVYRKATKPKRKTKR